VDIYLTPDIRPVSACKSKRGIAPLLVTSPSLIKGGGYRRRITLVSPVLSVEIASSLTLLAMTKGGVIASRRRGNLGGRVLLEIAKPVPSVSGESLSEFASATPRKDVRLLAMT
jgi:hypothetical protein